MEIIFVLVPISLFLAIAGCIAFRWALKSGQFDDTKTPSMRMVFDEEGSDPPTNSDTPSKQ